MTLMGLVIQLWKLLYSASLSGSPAATGMVLTSSLLAVAVFTSMVAFPFINIIVTILLSLVIILSARSPIVADVKPPCWLPNPTEIHRDIETRRQQAEGPTYRLIWIMVRWLKPRPCIAVKPNLKPHIVAECGDATHLPKGQVELRDGAVTNHMAPYLHREPAPLGLYVYGLAGFSL
jgi:hypothetical protein